MKKSIFGNVRYNNESNCSKLLFHTKFKGVSLDTGHYESTQRDWHQDFTDSIDSVTGLDLINDAKTLWGSSTEVDVLSIPQANVATVGEFETYFLNTITSEGLSLSIPSSHGDYPTYTGVPQTTFNIRRSAAQAAADDMDAICFSGRFKLPATLDLTGNNSAGQYCTIFEAKSGGYGGVGGVGDFRIQLMINRGAHGYNELQCKIDNSANGIGVIPGFDSLINYSLGYSGITAQLDVWTRYYIWWDRAAGRLTASIKVDGQESQIISDVYPADLIAGGLSSGTLYGLHDLPFTRIAACFMYATGGYPTTMVWEDLQVWDSIPQFLGWSEPVAVDASLAGGATQPREGTDTLSIDFTSSTPTQVTISRNDNPTFAVWPDGAMSESFTAVTGGLEFDLSLAHMNLGVNTIGVKASYADYRKATDALSVTIAEALLSYNDATFYAPLQTSLVLDEGTGSPTLTRATAMWVFDNEDKMITVPASAAAFGGAYRVRNWCRLKSEDLTSAAWSKSAVTATAQVMVSSAATVAMYCNNDMTGVLIGSIGESWLGSFRVEYVDIQYVQMCGQATGFGLAPLCNFDLINGDYTATGCTATMISVSAGIWDITVKFTSVASGIVPIIFLALVPSQTATRVQSFAGDGIKSVRVLRFQIENVTGQADQTAGDYVSVGVLSAPYHGGGADGIKWFATNKDGTAIPDSDLLGLATIPAAVTNTMLWCRDLTNAAWVKTNTTAAKDQIGLDKAANSCSLLTATAANATILQTITAAAAAGCTGFYVKRSIGTGTIEITRDNGSTWTDVTSLINGSTFTLVGIENTSVTNPVVGFRIGTSGDAIIVDGGINHLGTKLYHLPIITTTAAVTVNAQTLTYPTSGNISDTDGTIMATVQQDTWSAGGVVGSATHGLFASDATSGVQAKDGTNTASGETATPTGSVKLGCRWSGSSLEAFSATTYLSVGAATSYDGSFNLSTISVGSGIAGYVKDVAIYV